MEFATRMFFIKVGIISFWVSALYFCLSFNKYVSFSTQTSSRNLNILTWPQILDRDFLADFEKKHNVTVNITYCENNEEMIAKLLGSKHHGYDLVMPSHFFIDRYKELNLIKPLDRAMMPWFDVIDKQIVNLSFDPGNRYTVPCFWSVYGIGINHKVVEQQNIVIGSVKSWGLIFDPKLSFSVGMLEEFPQAYALVGLYLFNKIKNFSEVEHEKIMHQLIAQKKRVLVYTDMRVEYLLASGECPLVFSASADMAKMVAHYPHLEFYIPQEGSFALLDSFALTAQTYHDTLAYAFLDYLYNQKVITKYADKFEYISPITSNPLLSLVEKTAVYYFERIFSDKEYESLWIKLKAS